MTEADRYSRAQNREETNPVFLLPLKDRKKWRKGKIISYYRALQK